MSNNDPKQFSSKKNFNLNYENISSSSNSDDDDNPINLSETKNGILKAFDDHINKNKEEIKQMTLIKQKKNEIYKLAKDLKLDIKNLDLAINEIVKKQHNDYLNTFSSFMDSIRKELTQKLEEMERQAEEKKKANDIRLIKCERDFFRMEAVRLNGICKSFKEKIDELSFRNKLISDELNTLKIKWKESENINKQLLFELESNIQSYKELEEKFNNMKDLFDKKNINNKFKTDKSASIEENKYIYNSERKEGNKSNNLLESEIKELEEFRALDPLSKEKKILEINEKMKKYKTEAKVFKDKAHKALAELNKIYLEKNKYEGIFQNCVEETKKIIFNRRVKENKGFKIKNRTGIGKYDCKVNLSTKFEDFLPSDKLNTLENFLFNDEVFNLVKEIIFSKPKNKTRNIENTKNYISSFKYFEPDWKMKEIVENANESGENIVPKMPLINHGRSNSVLDKKNSSIINNGNHGRLLNIIEKNGFGSTSRLSVDLKVA